MMSLREAAMVLGTVASADASARFLQVSTDSRQLLPGSLFVALRGPRHDGHDHLAVVAAAGATGAIVERRGPINLPQLVVADTRLALARLAEYWRRRWPLTLVAITGSNGKTTVKEMAARIAAVAGSTLCTHGNQNNDIGVPLTLLRIRPFHQFAVVEMGMSSPGELTRLSAMGRPDIAVITNAGSAHLQNFREPGAVARAKAEIFRGLASDGVAVINGDDPAADLWRELAAPRRVVQFALDNSGAEIRGEWLPNAEGGMLKVCGESGQWQVQLPLYGRENGANALAAIAVGHLLEIPADQMARVLAQSVPVAGRLQILQTPTGARLINDTYNASPESLTMAIEVLAQHDGRRLLVLGDMAELGAQSEEFHRRAGLAAHAAGIETLLTIGADSRYANEAFGSGAEHFTNQQELVGRLLQIGAGDTVLVKGSRAAAMDQVVTAVIGVPDREVG